MYPINEAGDILDIDSRLVPDIIAANVIIIETNREYVDGNARMARLTIDDVLDQFKENNVDINNYEDVVKFLSL